MAEVQKPQVKNYVSSVGRRKEAVARVRLYAASKVLLFGKEYKKGDILVNGKPIQEFFNFTPYAPRYNKILRDTDTSDKYVISAKVAGGGTSGQIDAVILGIARALDKIDSAKHHKVLREKDYLMRDPRTRERRKVGNAGKARRKKSSPKR